MGGGKRGRVSNETHVRHYIVAGQEEIFVLPRRLFPAWLSGARAAAVAVIRRLRTCSWFSYHSIMMSQMIHHHSW